MPSLQELLQQGVLSNRSPQGILRQPQPSQLSGLLSMLMGVNSAQAAEPQWQTKGGLPTLVTSGEGGKPAQPVANPNVGFSRDQNAEGLVRALMARGIPEAQARAMAAQKLSGR